MVVERREVHGRRVQPLGVPQLSAWGMRKEKAPACRCRPGVEPALASSGALRAGPRSLPERGSHTRGVGSTSACGWRTGQGYANVSGDSRPGDRRPETGLRLAVVVRRADAELSQLDVV